MIWTNQGMGCADGQKQHLHTGKEEKTSPTITTEAVMLMSTINAKDGDVATMDITGAFMHSDQDETAQLHLQGTLTDLLVKCDPKLYHKYVVTGGGE